MSTTTESELMKNFPRHSYEDWKAAAESLLKGKSFEKLLISPTYESFDLDPIYMAETVDPSLFTEEKPSEGSCVRGNTASGYVGNSWKVSQEISAPTPKEANKVILKELAGGSNEINLWFDLPTRNGRNASSREASSVGRCGVSVSSLKDMEILLKDVHPEAIQWFLRSGSASLELTSLFRAWLETLDCEAKSVELSVDWDPIGDALKVGQFESDWESILSKTQKLSCVIGRHFRSGQAIHLNGSYYHDAGAASYQELAFLLAGAVEYLRGLSEKGMKISEIASLMRFTLAVGPNTFIEISKFRAFRKLWKRVLKACGEEEANSWIHARTGLYNKTRLDPYVNMLRTTTEAFSAVVGGCDSLSVGAFDEVIREPNEFSRRIARNTQIILSEECDLTKVIDPAGGSWAVETLTQKIAEQAWALFQEVEAKGGLIKALEAGYPQSLIEGTRQSRELNLQRRKDVLVGTNQFPNPKEKPLRGSPFDYGEALSERLKNVENSEGVFNPESFKKGSECTVCELVDAFEKGATLEQASAILRKESSEGLAIGKLQGKRLAEDYESLRAKNMGLNDSGVNTSLFQYNIGPSRAYRLRADWTSAFFEVAGFNVHNEEDFDDVGAALKALKLAGSKVVILVSDDSTYSEKAEQLVKELKTKNPEVKLILAGAPNEALKEAGVDDFVHVRVNNYEFNQSLLESLEG